MTRTRRPVTSSQITYTSWRSWDSIRLMKSTSVTPRVPCRMDEVALAFAQTKTLSMSLEALLVKTLMRALMIVSLRICSCQIRIKMNWSKTVWLALVRSMTLKMTNGTRLLSYPIPWETQAHAPWTPTWSMCLVARLCKIIISYWVTWSFSTS